MNEPTPDNPDETAEEPRSVPIDDMDAPDAAPEAPAEEEAPLLERYQRVCADYQNYQGRVAREMQQIRTNAQGDIVRGVLPILDDLDRAIGHAEQEAGESHPMLEGVRLIREKFIKMLAQYGVTEIPAVGEPFDPAVHSALMTEPREDIPPQTVIELFETGYRMGLRTLRPAKVKVSAPPPAEEPQSPPDEAADTEK